MHTEIISVSKLVIGNDCTIGNHCSLDSRGGLTIGNRCNISSHTLFVSGKHNIHSPDFESCELSIVVEDYVWICTRSLILGGITIGEGAVVAAGAVVTRSVEPYTVVAGVPAKVIGKREKNLSYNPSFMKSWI